MTNVQTVDQEGQGDGKQCQLLHWLSGIPGPAHLTH